VSGLLATSDPLHAKERPSSEGLRTGCLRISAWIGWHFTKIGVHRPTALESCPTGVVWKAVPPGWRTYDRMLAHLGLDVATIYSGKNVTSSPALFVTIAARPPGMTISIVPFCEPVRAMPLFRARAKSSMVWMP